MADPKTRQQQKETAAQAEKQQQPAEQPAETKPAQPAAPREPERQPTDEPADDADPELVDLVDRARAGGDDAAAAVVDAYELGADRSNDPTAEGITSADVAALRGRVASGRAARRPRRVLLSEGVRHDLERLGKVTDPGTGYELEMDRDTGEVTVYERQAAPASPAPQRRQVDVEIVGPGNEPQNT